MVGINPFSTALYVYLHPTLIPSVFVLTTGVQSLRYNRGNDYGAARYPCCDEVDEDIRPARACPIPSLVAKRAPATSSHDLPHLPMAWDSSHQVESGES